MQDILDETSLDRNLPVEFVEEMSKRLGGLEIVASLLRENPWRINFEKNYPEYFEAQR